MYIRPLQSSLDLSADVRIVLLLLAMKTLQKLALAASHDEKCPKCGVLIPVHVLKEHIMGCKLVMFY